MTKKEKKLIEEIEELFNKVATPRIIIPLEDMTELELWHLKQLMYSMKAYFEHAYAIRNILQTEELEFERPINILKEIEIENSENN